MPLIVIERTKDFLWFLREHNTALKGVNSIRSEELKDLIFKVPIPHFPLEKLHTNVTFFFPIVDNVIKTSSKYDSTTGMLEN